MVGSTAVNLWYAGIQIGPFQQNLSVYGERVSQDQRGKTLRDVIAVNTTVFLLNGTTTWTVPADFGSLVSVQCIGAGSGGNGSSTAGNIASGGGGAYAKITSTSTALTPGVTVINVGIGLGGAGVSGVTTTGNAGGDTWWNATSRTDAVTNGSGKSCAAQGGQAATSATGGLGGTAANSVGTATFSGGNGTVGTNAHGSGGAAGPNGAGASGSSTAGGSADGGTVAGPTVSAAGNSGTEFDATHGCGTGSFSSASPTRAGGLYGGAGNSFVSLFSGAGANGLLVITYTVFVAAPFSNLVATLPFNLPGMPPQRITRNQLLFTAVPFAQTDWSAQRRVADFLPASHQPTNINLFKNPIPFAQLDWSVQRRVSDFLPGATLYNVNLYGGAEAAPFAQLDWSVPRRVSDFLPAAHQPTNINIYTNPIPFSQTDWSVQRRVADFLPPTALYNINLYGLATAAPFAQLDWGQVRRVADFLPPAHQALNLNLYTNPIPFAQYSWPSTFNIPGQPPQRAPYNINLYTAVGTEILRAPMLGKPALSARSAAQYLGTPATLLATPTAAPFVPIDWSVPRRVADFLPPLQPYNVLIFSEVPFGQTEWPRQKKPPVVPPQSQPYNGLLYSEVPFNQLDWPTTHAVPDFPVARQQPLNMALSDLNPIPFGQDVWLAPAVPPISPPQRTPYNINIFSEVPFAADDFGQARFPRVASGASAGLNLNLLTVVAAPFVPIDWSRPFMARPASAPAPQFNPNLFTNPIPFAQFDWSKASSVPRVRQFDPQPNYTSFYPNPIPFAQYDWGKTARAYQPQPQQFLFPNILGGVAAPPFIAIDWSRPLAIRQLPPAPVGLNINLVSVVLSPFSQYFWPPVLRARPLQSQAQAYNPNIFSEVPFVPVDWSARARRVTAAQAPQQPYNFNIYTNAVPFFPVDWSKPFKVAALPPDQRHTDITRFTNPMPFRQAVVPPVVVPSRPPSLTYSNTLFLASTTVPFTNLDWAVTRKLPRFAVPASVASRALLTPVSTMPFAQTFWEPSRRVAPAWQNVYSYVPYPAYFRLLHPNYIAVAKLRYVVSSGDRQFVAGGASRSLIAASGDRQLVADGPSRSRIVVGITNNVAQTNQLEPAIDSTVEEETVTFDYGLILATGVTITSVVSVTCNVAAGSEGSDPSPASRLINGAQIAASPSTEASLAAVNQLVGDMLGGVTYLLQCVVNTSDGQKLSLWTHLPCVTPA
jgi:hypothetical protein